MKDDTAPLRGRREIEARAWATLKHAAQTRRYTGEPYINHPEAVVELVRSVPHTDSMLIAAWLHDIVEDTEATLVDVEARFGGEVAELVAMLTKVTTTEDGTRSQRAAREREHLSMASADAQTIKLADIIDNCGSIGERDPSFAKTYIKEKLLVLEVLTQGDPTLKLHAEAVLQDAETQLREFQ